MLVHWLDRHTPSVSTERASFWPESWKGIQRQQHHRTSAERRERKGKRKIKYTETKTTHKKKTASRNDLVKLKFPNIVNLLLRKMAKKIKAGIYIYSR